MELPFPCYGMQCEFLYSLIPFLFTFAIVYASLEVSNVLGKNKGAKVLVSFAIAFFSITSSFYLELVYSFLPYFSIILIGIFAFLLIKTLLIDKLNLTSKNKKVNILILLAIFLVIMYFGNTLFPLPYPLSSDLVFLLGLVLVLIIFYLAYGEQITN